MALFINDEIYWLQSNEEKYNYLNAECGVQMDSLNCEGQSVS